MYHNSKLFVTGDDSLMKLRKFVLMGDNRRIWPDGLPTGCFVYDGIIIYIPDCDGCYSLQMRHLFKVRGPEYNMLTLRQKQSAIVVRGDGFDLISLLELNKLSDKLVMCDTLTIVLPQLKALDELHSEIFEYIL